MNPNLLATVIQKILNAAEENEMLKAEIERLNFLLHPKPEHDAHREETVEAEKVN